MHSDAAGITYAGLAVGFLGVAGAIGTFLVWRRRPRRHVARALLAAPPRQLVTVND